MSRPTPPLAPAFLTRPIAHRALHGPGRPENSLAAVHAAVEAGFGIEIDLQLSSDGVAMVFHDATLDRLTEASGPVIAQSAADLGTLTLLGTEETILTLAQVLAAVASRVPLLIEIKDRDGALGPNVGVLEQAAAAQIEGYDGPVAVMSFNPHSVAEMARWASQIPRGLITCDFHEADWPDVPERLRDRLREIPDYTNTGATFISHQAADLHRPRVADLKAAGAAILCWTIRDAAAEAQARTVADNVTFEGYLPTATQP